MPCYPAFALLIGSAMAAGGKWIKWGTHTLTAIAAVCALAAAGILFYVRHLPAPGDIAAALSHQATYKLSLGHMQDLTLESFAYLRVPLALAAVGFLVGAVGTLRARRRQAFLAMTVMMVLFYQAARLALIAFDPFLSSRPLASAILDSPPGMVIVDTQYWLLSSIPFYTQRPELLLNGRWFNLEYGSNAPGSPNVFINDADFQRMWLTSQRLYLVTKEANVPRIQQLVGSPNLDLVAKSGGKYVFTNSALDRPHP